MTPKERESKLAEAISLLAEVKESLKRDEMPQQFVLLSQACLGLEVLRKEEEARNAASFECCSACKGTGRIKGTNLGVESEGNCCFCIGTGKTYRLGSR